MQIFHLKDLKNAPNILDLTRLVSKINRRKLFRLRHHNKFLLLKMGRDKKDHRQLLLHPKCKESSRIRKGRMSLFLITSKTRMKITLLEDKMI
jgi:hypothetical protein